MKRPANHLPKSAIAPTAAPANPLGALGKGDLHRLAGGLLHGEPSAISACLEFIEAETKGCWHGRARAMMCRRLKHCSLSSLEKARLVTCILGRLCSGDFSEQFKDQLRLAIRLDPEKALKAARSCAGDSRDYVRRYGNWLLARLPKMDGSV